MKLSLNYIRILSMIIYAISLTQKAYCTNNDCGEYFGGFICTLMGPLGLMFGGIFLTWLANPFLYLAWIFYKRKIKLSIFFSSIALIIALSFMSFDDIIVTEAGHTEKITGYASGYWLWIASMLTIISGSLINIISKKNIDSEIKSNT